MLFLGAVTASVWIGDTDVQRWIVLAAWVLQLAVVFITSRCDTTSICRMAPTRVGCSVYELGCLKAHIGEGWAHKFAVFSAESGVVYCNL